MKHRDGVLFGMYCVLGMVSILFLSACGTTQHTAQSDAMSPPSHQMVAPTETVMTPNAEVRPSRYAMLFDTLEVPPFKVEAQTPPSKEFLLQLQQAIIQQIRTEHLFANVVTEAEARALGGVLTLNAKILSWDAQPEEGLIEIRLGIEDMGSSCEFTHATTKGSLKPANNSSVASEPYDIQPLVEGTAAFVVDFMNPMTL